MRKFLSLLLAVGLAFSSAKAQLPDFTQTDCNGQTYNLYTELAAGRPVVLKFCAGWCAPCAFSNPPFQRVWEQYQSGNCKLKMFSVLIDDNTVNNPSDCADGIEYATKYNLTMPTLTDVHPMYRLFALAYDINAIPTTLVIIPDVSNPANSSVNIIVGADEDLDEQIIEKLEAAGFYSPRINIDGTLCADPPNAATLTSNFTTGNLWSTGETTQSISINQSGIYSLQINDPAVCPGNVSRNVQFLPALITGVASSTFSTMCRGGFTFLEYTLPAGSPEDVQWLVQYPGSSAWDYFDVANNGASFFEATDYSLTPGSEVRFKVRAATANGSCEKFSNEIVISITDAGTDIFSGTATASAPIVCAGAPFQLTYTGSNPFSFWEYFSPDQGRWFFFASADVVINPNDFINCFAISYQGSVPLRFRVRSLNGCSSTSNEVEVSFYPTGSLNISGGGNSCPGSSQTLSINGGFSNLLWSTGETSNSIIVTSGETQTYSVSATDVNGCSVSASTTVTRLKSQKPLISLTSAGSVCGGGNVVLSFGGTTSTSACTDAILQWPETTYSVNDCNGNNELITDQGFVDEYSLINVVAGNYYKFSSDFQHTSGPIICTILSEDGTIVHASGMSSAIWKASTTGVVRFSTHLTGCQAEESLLINRFVACSDNLSSFGTVLWMPGGQTTPSINVSPNVSTAYTLAFTDNNINCPTVSIVTVIVGIGAVTLTTTNITTNSAKLNWTSSQSPDQWQIRYKTTSAANNKWVEVTLPGFARNLTVTSLANNQNYMWQIRGKCGKNWTGYSGVEKFMTGSPLPSSSPFSFDDDLQTTAAKVDITVRVAPNPSSTNFKISLPSIDTKTPATLIVTDMLGRFVETRVVNSQQTVTIGDNYKTGTYFIKITQGEMMKQFKVIKL